MRGFFRDNEEERGEIVEVESGADAVVRLPSVQEGVNPREEGRRDLLPIHSHAGLAGERLGRPRQQRPLFADAVVDRHSDAEEVQARLSVGRAVLANTGRGRRVVTEEIVITQDRVSL